MESEMWVIENEKKSKLKLDDLKFIFEQAEKQLKDTLDTSSIIVGRANTLVALISSLLIALLGVAVTKFESSHPDVLFFTSLLGSAYVFVIGLHVIKNIKSTEYVLFGEPPKTYIDDIYFVVESNINNARLSWYYLNTIQQYQKRIDINKSVNNKRWGIYEDSLKYIIYTPIALAAIYIIAKLFVTQILK